jgi:hypothetical protein
VSKKERKIERMESFGAPKGGVGGYRAAVPHPTTIKKKFKKKANFVHTMKSNVLH